MFPVAVCVPIPASHVEAVHGVKEPVASSVALNVPAAHLVQVPPASVDPYPIQHLSVAQHTVSAPPPEVLPSVQAVQSASAVRFLVATPTMLFVGQVVAEHVAALATANVPARQS